MSLRLNQLEEIKSFLRTAPGIINLYENKKPEFFEKTLSWLKTMETILENNRLHIVSLVSAQRGSLLASQQGIHLEEKLIKGRTSKRKRYEGTAINALSQTIELVNTSISDDVERFREAEKLCQLIITIAQTKHLTSSLESISSHTHRMASLDALCSSDTDIASHLFNLKAIVNQQDALILLDQTLTKNLS